MTAAQYRSALDAARQELDELLGQRSELETRIAQLRQTVATLAALCDETPDLDIGLTEACRSVLRGATALRAPDIRDRVTAMGVDLSTYANGIGAVHTVLKRLIESGEVKAMTGYDKRTVYWWNYPLRSIVIPRERAKAPDERSKRKTTARGGREHERR
jgi:Mg2+ and Co2+ transporter CorA